MPELTSERIDLLGMLGLDVILPLWAQMGLFVEQPVAVQERIRQIVPRFDQLDTFVELRTDWPFAPEAVEKWLEAHHSQSAWSIYAKAFEFARNHYGYFRSDLLGLGSLCPLVFDLYPQAVCTRDIEAAVQLLRSTNESDYDRMVLRDITGVALYPPATFATLEVRQRRFQIFCKFLAMTISNREVFASLGEIARTFSKEVDANLPHAFDLFASVDVSGA